MTENVESHLIVALSAILSAAAGAQAKTLDFLKLADLTSPRIAYMSALRAGFAPTANPDEWLRKPQIPGSNPRNPDPLNLDAVGRQIAHALAALDPEGVAP